MTQRETMTELEREAARLCTALDVRDWNDPSKTVQYMTKENAIALALKYAERLASK